MTPTLGFSAGGNLTALTGTNYDTPQYPAADDDEVTPVNSLVDALRGVA